MVLVCLSSDALSQHLPSYLGFSYLGRGVSLHCCSSKAQLLLLTFDKGYLLTAAPPDLECAVAPLAHPAPAQPPLLEHGVAPLGRHPWLWMWGSSSWPPPLTLDIRIIEKAMSSRKTFFFLLYWLCQSLWLCGSQQTVENSERDGNTRPPDPPLEKPICRSGSNS